LGDVTSSDVIDDVTSCSILSVQDLEGIEDTPVDDETKRIWLTNTLSSQSDMDAAICQAITTELTIHGTKGGSGKTNVTWTIL
jgi:hypothetical protein